MKELVEVIAKALVDHPDEVVVTETENAKSIVLELKVAQDDMGKVIGKQGRLQRRCALLSNPLHPKMIKKLLWRFCSKDFH